MVVEHELRVRDAASDDAARRLDGLARQPLVPELRQQHDLDHHALDLDL